MGNLNGVYKRLIKTLHLRHSTKIKRQLSLSEEYFNFVNEDLWTDEAKCHKLLHLKIILLKVFLCCDKPSSLQSCYNNSCLST